MNQKTDTALILLGLILIAIGLSLLSCGSQPTQQDRVSAADAGSGLPPAPDWLEEINKTCKKWDYGSITIDGKREWFTYCTRW